MTRGLKPILALVEAAPDLVFTGDAGGRLHRLDMRSKQSVAPGLGAARAVLMQGEQVWMLAERGLVRWAGEGDPECWPLADGRCLALSQGHLWVGLGDGRVLRGPSPEALEPTPWRGRHTIHAICAAPEGVVLVEEGLCELRWLDPQGALLRRIGGPQACPFALVSGGEWLYSLDEQILTRIHLDESLDSTVFSGALLQGQTQLACSADGLRLFTAGGDRATFWSTDPLRPALRLPLGGEPCSLTAAWVGAWCGLSDGMCQRLG